MKQAIALVIGLGCGCVPAPSPSAGPGAVAPERVEMPEQPRPDDTAEPVREIATPPVDSTSMISLRPDAGLDPLAIPSVPASWSNPYPKARAFADELKAATAARASFEAVASSIASVDAGVPAAKQFERVSALLDLASRRYATAYHAADATTAGRITVLHDAAAMILAWSRRLDEAGLAKAPAAYKADPLIALTYEDVADGPAKRWRQDGLSLLRLCIDTAHTAHVDDAAARDCSTMRSTYVRVLAKTPASTGASDAGIGACACNPGDPLCSSSMNGWCREAK